MKIIIINLLMFIYAFSMDKIYIDIPKKITIPKLKGDISKYSFSVKEAKIKPFYISKYETTVKEYKNYLKATKQTDKNINPESNDDEPVTNIDFKTAQKVCNFYGGRLPTELEWVVSASIKVAPSKCYEFIKKYSFVPYPTAKYPLNYKDKQIKCMSKEDDEIEPEYIGSELSDVQDSYENINGTYGMLGNVWEWVDAEKIYFNQKYKVIKGGSFANFHQKKLFDSRISNFVKENTKMSNIGFRCVWDKNASKKGNKK